VSPDIVIRYIAEITSQKIVVFQYSEKNYHSLKHENLYKILKFFLLFAFILLIPVKSFHMFFEKLYFIF